MKTCGDIVLINGKEYVLGKEIGGGLEGKVFEIEALPNYVIKLLNTSKLTNKDIDDSIRHLKWLKEIVGKNPELMQKLAVPKALIDNELGYVMVKASAHKDLKTYITFPQGEQEFTEWYKENYKLKKRLQIIAYMFNALELIHISGLVFTDLSPNNIMVNDDKNNLVFIDTDNMRRRSDAYISVLGTEGYMAPEVYHYLDKTIETKLKELNIDQNILSNSGKLTVDSDVFSAAIIAFQLLTLQHPFIGDKVEEGTADEETNAYHCQTDYILTDNTDNFSSNPFVQLLQNEGIATTKIKDLFKRTFVNGKDNPMVRPTAIEFYEAFSEAIDMVAKCPDCSTELLYRVDADNKCWDCDTVIPKKTYLQIFNVFEERDRNKLVSQIVGSDLGDISASLDNRFLMISQMVLNENENKVLYLRHFEKTNKRSSQYAIINLLSESAGTAEILVRDSTVITDCSLRERKTGKLIPISNTAKAYQFSVENYVVMFEITDSRLGKVSTIGCFYRGESK